MQFICKYCKDQIERDRPLYSIPYYYDPLWLHLQDKHKDMYELMCDFENPYRIEDLFEYNEDEFYEFLRYNSNKGEDRRDIFHVHTRRCLHASDEPDEEYVKKALDLGASKITFTDHAPFPGDPFTHRMNYDQLPEYINSIKSLKKAYDGRIEVVLGLEIEYLPSFKTYYEELRANPDIEVLMIGQHMFELSPGDYSFKHEGLWYPEVADSLIEAIKTGFFDGTAHPDRIYKFEESWTPQMDGIARTIIRESGLRGMFIEQNEESKRTENYYWQQFWDITEEMRNSFDTPLRILRGVDAHSTAEINYRFIT